MRALYLPKHSFIVSFFENRKLLLQDQEKIMKISYLRWLKGKLITLKENVIILFFYRATINFFFLRFKNPSSTNASKASQLQVRILVEK